MALRMCGCGHWQQATEQDGKQRDAHEIGFFDSEASSATAVSTETPEPEGADSVLTPRTHDSIDSLFFPDLHSCDLDAATVESPGSPNLHGCNLPIATVESRQHRGSSAVQGNEKIGVMEGRQLRPVEEGDLTQSLTMELGHMPPVEVPIDSPHLVIKDRHIQDLSLVQLEQALLEDSILEQYLLHCSKSYDISLSSWGSAPGGIRVRRARFTMPVPQDLPPALARMVAVPQVSRATLLLGFAKPGEDEVLVWLQQFTHDVPYGENFRVQETMRFRLHPEGGLIFHKWTLVKWVKALPWIMAPMKPITESKTATGAIAAADAFMDAIRKSAHSQR